MMPIFVKKSKAVVLAEILLDSNIEFRVERTHDDMSDELGFLFYIGEEGEDND